LTELVINASNIISPLCYSVLRVEPYTVCPFECTYCYSRWYMKNPPPYVAPRWRAAAMFRDTARKVRRRGMKPIPFRLSTLVDPLPPHEELYRASEEVLKTALDLEYPIAVNTKSDLIARDPWRRLLEKLMDRGLAVLQISISALDDRTVLVEPNAPPPSARLRVLKEFAGRGYPLVVRLSPFIPGFSPTVEGDVREFAATMRDLGVRQVIVEALRLESEAIELFLRRIGAEAVDLEDYSLREVEGLKPVKRVSRGLLEKIYRTLSEELKRFGVEFSTCKDGLLHLSTAPDCCGFWMLRDYALRATLLDVYRYLLENGPSEASRALVESACRRFSRVCGEELKKYPNIISKPLRYHERKMLKVLTNSAVAEVVAPPLRYLGKIIVAARHESF